MSVYPDLDALEQLAEHIKLRRGDEILDTQIAFGELTVTTDLSSLLDLVEFLRSDSSCRFTTLIDMTAVDYPERAQRFDVVWHLLSMYQNHRIRVKVAIREDEIVPSLTGIYPCANWFEREVFDMFGILFSGHPDLRRLMTDYGFVGHPFRKDFPLIGNVEVRYDAGKKRVVYEPVTSVEPRVGVPRVIRDDARYLTAAGESRARGAETQK
mgnify:CR=1 FL=1